MVQVPKSSYYGKEISPERSRRGIARERDLDSSPDLRESQSTAGLVGLTRYDDVAVSMSS
jgi:hypothetical protein